MPNKLIYRPFHKALPRSRYLYKLDFGKVLLNELYGRNLKHCSATLIIDYLGLSLVKAISLFFCPRPVIGQIAIYVQIATLLNISTVANLYL